MKTTVHLTTKVKFPKLQIAINGNIFLMNNETSGTLIHSEMENIRGIGDHFHELIKENLTDFRGSITLEN